MREGCREAWYTRLERFVYGLLMPKSRRTRRSAASKDCAVVYLRVSTTDQVRHGAGLDAQEAECRAYAERQGWKVTGVFVDDVDTGTSGTVHPTQRPGLASAVAALDACEAGVLLVRRQDRICRLPA